MLSGYADQVTIKKDWVQPAQGYGLAHVNRVSLHALIAARQWIPRAHRRPGQIRGDGHGSCTQLREYCEARGQGYVLRVPSNFRLTLARGVKLPCKQAAARLRAGGPGGEVRSAGKGSKGDRWYARAWIATISPRHYLLIRRHRATGELAPSTTVTCPKARRCRCPG
jgi:hypothetical protein